ncbi:TonB family protein [Myxococcota bacterium]|nr:TonB family protein [Myxococcota bacterium]
MMAEPLATANDLRPLPSTKRVLRIAVSWHGTILDSVDVSSPGDVWIDAGDGARRIATLTTDGAELHASEPRWLRTGERATFERDALTYVVDWVEPSAALAARGPADWSLAFVFSVSGLLHAFFVLAAWVTPREGAIYEDTRWARGGVFSAQILKKIDDAPKRRPALDLRAGRRAKGEEGRIGREDTPRADAARSRGGAPRVDPSKRAHDRDVARSSGLLGLFHERGGAAAVSNVFGPGGLGGGLNDALGGVRGHRFGDTAGVGGLATRGTGPGGGGDAIGIGGLASHGNGRGDDGYADVALEGRREAKIRPGRTILVGALGHEEVARVIRRSLSRFKFCYERELSRDPNLAGKIAVAFTIDPLGHVTDVKIEASSLDDDAVERCVTAVMRSLEMPKPRGGGVVHVTYPFVFASTD